MGFVFVLSSRSRGLHTDVFQFSDNSVVSNIMKAIQPSTRAVVLPDNDTAYVQPEESKSCQVLLSYLFTKSELDHNMDELIIDSVFL